MRSLLTRVFLVTSLFWTSILTAHYEYKNINLKSLYLKYRTGFILVDEVNPAYIKFDFSLTAHEADFLDLEDKLVQVTIFSVDELYNAFKGDNKYDFPTLTALLEDTTFCCSEVTLLSESCYQENSMYSELLLAIKDYSQTYFVDIETGEKDGNGNIIIDTNAVFSPEKSGLYALMFSFCEDEGIYVTINGVSTWKSSGGLLPAEMYGYLEFYGKMANVYLVVTAIWGYLCYRKWKQLLLLQNWITCVLILSMVEIFLRYFDFHSFNANGVRNNNLLLISLIFMSVKKSISRMLVLVVVSGFGIIKATLGPEKNRVLNIGVAYFSISLLDSMVQSLSSPLGNERHTYTSASSKLFLQLPLAVLDLYFVFWTFKSLGTTLLSLEKRGQVEKLLLFQRFRILLQLSVLFSVVWLAVSVVVKVSIPVSWADDKYDSRFFTWSNLYLLDCVWDVVYLVILLAVMVLWLPTERSLKYSYTAFKAKKDDEVGQEFDDNLSVEDTKDLKLYKNGNNEMEQFLH